MAGEREGLLHDVRPMVSYRARRKLDAVADDVILNSLDAENCLFIGRIEPEKSLGIEIRHRKRIMRKVDFLLVLVPFVHRKIDDPAELVDVLFREAEFTSDTKPRGTGEFGGLVFLVASEKHRVAGFETGFFRDFPLHFGGQKFGDRPFAREPPALAFEDNIAKTRRAFALRPIVELIEKGARPTGRTGRRNGAHDAARLDDILEG